MAESLNSPGKAGNSIYDVIIVGAGLSGIGTAYWLQDKCPNKTYAILEAREALGGTWDLFRYPGIRSDSDMFTFGYRFKPWKDPKSLSDGDSILQYLQEAATENGIDKKICYGHKVLSAGWSGKEMCWTLEVQSSKETRRIRCHFLYMCSGYYSYEEAHRPSFCGEENFKGRIVLPQFWPEDLEYNNKQIVIVGSGATAITLVPAMAERASHVTMLQRSPTYIMNLPDKNKLFIGLKKWLPGNLAFNITRWRNLLLGMASYQLLRAFPTGTKRFLINTVSKQLEPGYDVEKHFNPRYNPWDQRLCVVPDGDLFKAIRKGKASVVTDEIAHLTEKGIQLKSGQHIEADIIVLATGLKIKLLGGAGLTVNEKVVNMNDAVLYKGMMISDVPNLAIAFGYTNASWTLKADLTANYVCRLLRYMDRKGYSVVMPGRQDNVQTKPFINFTSGYVQRAGNALPQQGSRKPWRVYQSYLMDMITIRFGRIKDNVLQFDPKQSKS